MTTHRSATDRLGRLIRPSRIYRTSDFVQDWAAIGILVVVEALSVLLASPNWVTGIASASLALVLDKVIRQHRIRHLLRLVEEERPQREAELRAKVDELLRRRGR